jgi:hypothetical protein
LYGPVQPPIFKITCGWLPTATCCDSLTPDSINLPVQKVMGGSTGVKYFSDSFLTNGSISFAGYLEAPNGSFRECALCQRSQSSHTQSATICAPNFKSIHPFTKIQAG